MTYNTKPIKFVLARQRRNNHTWYNVAMQYNGNTFILKEYSKSKSRALEYVRMMRAGIYKNIPNIPLESLNV